MRRSTVIHDKLILVSNEAIDKEQGFIQLSNSSIACAESRTLDTELFKKTRLLMICDHDKYSDQPLKRQQQHWKQRIPIPNR